MQNGSSPEPYDFHRCKLCGKMTAAPLFRLAEATLYACGACDFHCIDVLDDMRGGLDDGAQEIDGRAWDYIEARLRGNAPIAQRRLQLIGRYGALQGMTCLDIGAGAGDFAALLGAAGARVRGIEPSRIRRIFARRRFGLEVHAETIEELCRRDDFAGRFDIVTLWDVIEHVNFPAETLRGAAKVLKPGGLLFLDTPSRDALSYRLSETACRLSGGKIPLFFGAFYSTAPFGHKQIFRPPQIEQLARDCGLDVLSRGSGFGPHEESSSVLRPRNRIVLVCRRL